MAGEIRKYVLPLPGLRLYNEIVKENFYGNTRITREEKRRVDASIEALQVKQSKAREFLLTGDIDLKCIPVDYHPVCQFHNLHTRNDLYSIH